MRWTIYAMLPLMRFRAIRIRDGAYRFLWTHHHLLVDGRECERWVLADWYAHGSYLEFDEEGGRTRDV